MRTVTKWLLSLLVFSLMLVFSLPTEASEMTVYDQANLFTADELADLAEMTAEFRATEKMDAVVVTTSNAEGKTAEAYADDFYDNGNYGLGAKKSGFLFLIDMDNRTYHISTAGHTIKLFTDQRIERMLDRAERDMRNGDYASAAASVLKDALNYSQKVDYDNVTGTFKKVRKISLLEGIIAVIAAAVAGVVSFSSVYGTYNLKRGTYKYAYRDQGHLALRSKEDQLVNTATTSRYIPPSNSGGGGSSTHSSSGGSSHGGGGRGF